jgi:cell division protein FtsI/penicillin-binding protein 2
MRKPATFLNYHQTLLLLIRIFYLQVINDSFKLKSDNNAIKIKYDYPERGYIFDRYGKLLVSNQASYDIMVIPRVKKHRHFRVLQVIKNHKRRLHKNNSQS